MTKQSLHRAGGRTRTPRFGGVMLAVWLFGVTQPASAQRPVVIELDNDALNLGLLGQASDGEYTQGMRIRIPEPGRSVVGRWLFPALPACGGEVAPDACQDWSLVIGQEIYTPGTDQSRLWPEHRPFAGWLGASMQTGLHTRRFDHELSITVGLTGPGSLAGPAQRWFHELIGEGTWRGWEGQLSTEPTFGIAYRGAARPVRYRMGPVSTASIRPIWNMALGTVRTEVGAGVEAALEFRPSGGSGWPGIALGSQSSGIYLLGAFSGRLIANDLFLDGGFFRSGRSVGHQPVVYVTELGLGIRVSGRSFEWRVVRASRLYPSQQSPHTYTTLAIAQ